MLYSSYDFYVNNYLLGRNPTIENKDFDFFVQKASNFVDDITYNKATQIDKVKLCVCELAELLYVESNKEEISSEKVGEYSINYINKPKAEIDNEKMAIARKHLANTGLLYCGV